MRRLTFMSMASLAVPLMLSSAPAWAQGAAATSNRPPAPNTGLQDIVVTATRQATNLQDTPLAITAVTSEAIEAKGITAVDDLTSVVPNTQFRKTQGAYGPGVSAFIRGVGQLDTSLAVEPAVAFYLDDVYYPLLLGSNFDLLEIDRIEVLRGPQGTLFGRNSLAGAVNIVSKQPSTTEASAHIQLTAGNFDRREIRASVNLPLSDSLAVSLSGLSKKRTGYQRILDFTCEMNRRGTPALAGSLPYSDLNKLRSQNNCTIGHLGGEDVQAYRGTLLWKAADNVRITVSADYIRDNSENAADSIVSIHSNAVTANANSAAAFFGAAYDERFLTGTPFATYATYNDPIAAGTVIPGNTFYNGFQVNGTSVRGGSRFEPFTDLTNWGVSGKVSWDITPDVNLLAVVSHRELDSTQTYDDDGSPLNLTQRLNTNTESYWTAEARLSGKSDFVDWVVGAFYFKADGRQRGLFISPSSGQQRTINSTFDPTSKAVFANATVRPFGEKLGFNVGARYSDDKKVVNFSNLVDTTPDAARDTVFSITPSQKRVDWKAGINYQATPHALFYVSAASGNSLPGFNSRPTQKTQIYQIDGNEDIAYELGAKLDLFDRRVRLNVAAFYTDFKNRPTTIRGAEALLGPDGNPVPGNRTLEPLPEGPPGSTQCGAILPTNTGVLCSARTYPRNQPATVRGFEAEYTINPIDGLLINGSVGWSKLKAGDISARAANRRQDNPYWTANAGVQYTIPVTPLDGTLTPRLDWIYESSQVFSTSSTALNYLMRGRSIFNARLTYENEEYDFSVSAGATNLFNKTYYLNVFDSQALGAPYEQAQPAAPRQWYLTVSKSF
ncbi:MAG TPA: TonB-dependent receptor [Sphingomonadaceae bacterium]|nr:TonB-dependent receptor [Sphingomonadaceae bacterium]